jgi:general secretion pathway protein D
MTPLLRFCLPSRRFLENALLCLCLLSPLEAAGATNEVAFTFENADIQTVIKKVGALTGTTFLLDPAQVKGKITLLAPRKVSPEGALQLLQSALALHGYTLLKKAEGTWVVPAEQATQADATIEVVPLKYARADEVADTLSSIAPSGVRIVPYYPTNSLIISGNPEAVEELIGILRGKEKRADGQ